ncbi:MAG: hypothetical protein AAGH89_14880, partial [Verrucomicrobiota bacterium]
MNTVEQALYNALQHAPEDWTVRFELLDKLTASGAHAEVLQVIGEATVAPDAEGDLRKVTEYAVKAGQPAAAEPILSAFVAHKPSSAVGHYLTAKLQSKTGNLVKAREHYNTAVALNSELVDEVLAAKLASLDEPAVAEVAEPAMPEEPVAVVAEPEQPVVVVPEPTPVPAPTPAPAIAEIKAPTAIPAPMTPPPGVASGPVAPVAQVPTLAEPEVEEPEAESAITMIPAVEADVAPPTNPLKPVPDLKETAAHMVTPEEFDSHAHLVEQDGAEAVEFEDHLHQTRHLMVADAGEVIKAMEKTDDKNQKMSSVVIAVVAHVVLALLFGL